MPTNILNDLRIQNAGTALTGLAQMNGGAGVVTAAAAADISAALDTMGAVRGDLLYRGATLWSALAPGTAGYVLTSGGAGADPVWAPEGHVGDVTSVAGTANQVLVNGVTAPQVGAVVVSLPTAIAGVNSITSATSQPFTLATLDANQNIIFSPNGTGKIGIGTAAPQQLLTISGTANANVLGEQVSADSNSSGILGLKARGSFASPAFPQAADNLFSFGGGGWNGTTLYNYNKGLIAIRAVSLWSASDNSTSISFNTTPVASVTREEVFVMASSGNISRKALTIITLTSGRVPFASTAGLLIDSANMTFNGTLLAVTGLTVFATSAAVTSASTNATSINIINTDTGGKNWSIASSGSLAGPGPGVLFFFDGTGTRAQLTATGFNSTALGAAVPSSVAATTLSSTGTFRAGTAGTSILNIRHGTSGALTAGLVVVTDTGATANTRYFFTTKTLGTISLPVAYRASARSVGVSFTIQSQNALDTSTVDWLAIEP